MSFPYFARLPPELQDLVWEFFIPKPSPPIAHLAHLQHEGIMTFVTAQVDRPLQGNHTPSLKRSCGPIIDTEPYRGFDRPAALRTLLQTTSRSRAVSLGQSDAMKPVESALLARGGESRPNADELCPELRINTASDIVVLDRDWYFGLQPHSLGRPGLQCPEPIRHIAVRDPENERHLVLGIHRLLKGYHQLRVLYVLLSPGELRDSERPWEQDLTSLAGFNEREEVNLEGYLAAYVEGRIHPGPFQCGHREYFEIPAQKIRSLGGLKSIIDVLETTRVLRSKSIDTQLVANVKSMAEGQPDTMNGMEPTRFRFMSWRHL